MAMTLEVYATDAEAFEATAALAAERLGAAAPRLTVALSGGRTGRGVMLALAARGDLPWERVEWFLADERCVAADDPRSNARLARESLFGPRGIAPARVHLPPVALGDPERIAAAYAETLGGALALVLLGVDARGQIAGLAPGCAALGSPAAVAAVRADEGEEPRVDRVTLAPPALAAAGHVIVTAVGEESAAAVSTALGDGADPARVPAVLVRPSPRVTWVVDRAAAGVLLRDARPA